MLHRVDGVFEIGDIVVAHHPFKRDVMLIKQAAVSDDPDRVRLLGLNPGESTDSRSFGPVRAAAIVGRVTCRLPPAAGAS